MYDEAFARVYDRLMDDFDYPAWADYYERLIADAPGNRVCECACGTGTMAVQLAKRGYRVTASDLSEGMLRAAAQKARAAGVMIPFVRQDMRFLDLPRPADAILCPCDGVNYLTGEGDARAFFARANAQLVRGGVLAFDISSRDKLIGLTDAPYYEDRDEVTYFWKNSRAGELIRMELTFFVRQGGGLYARFDETHVQRAHRVEEILAWLKAEGFTDVRALGDRTLCAPRPGEARWHFTAKKGLE